MTKKKPDGDEEGNKEIVDGNTGKQLKLLQIKDKERSNKDANSDRLRESQQKHRIMEMSAISQIQSINEAVRVSDEISKELAVVISEVGQKKEDLVSESDKLIEAGDPESQKFCQTLKFRGKETTLFYKSPSWQAIDEAVARKIF